MEREAFDESTAFEAEIQPLMQQIFERCQALNLPVLVAVCPRSTPERYYASVSANLPGYARTPDAMAAAFGIMDAPSLAPSVLGMIDALKAAEAPKN